MGRIGRVWAVVVACIALAGAVIGVRPAVARAQAHRVELRSNFFYPGSLRISPGDTVVFTAVEQGHTVASEDGRFNWPPGTRAMASGETFSFTFPLDETLSFYCRVHGQLGGMKQGSYNMLGRIVVGSGGPAVPQPGGAPETRDVPSQYSTIQSALTLIPPGSTVRVAPGVYTLPVAAPNWQTMDPPLTHASVTVNVDRVTIVGTGSSPSQTVIDGLGERPSGIAVAADGVTIRNLTVRGHTSEGVAARSVTGFRTDRVVSTGNGWAGIVVSDSTGSAITDSTASGGSFAGIHVKQCSPCDTRIERVTAEGSLFGVVADNVDGLTVRASTVRGNATGIVIRSVATDRVHATKSVVVEGNTILSNTAAIPRAGTFDFPVASGVWLAGQIGATVRGNTIDGHDYGVLIAALGAPSLGARIESNVISNSAKADIGFDGIGVNVCLAGNSRPGGGAVSTRPPLAETLYACALPATVGVPDLSVLADVLAYLLAGAV